MSIAMTKSVGKAKVTIEAKGCIVCGTEHAEGWSVARQIKVSIGLKRGVVKIGICDGCKKEKKPTGGQAGEISTPPVGHDRSGSARG